MNENPDKINNTFRKQILGLYFIGILCIFDQRLHYGSVLKDHSLRTKFFNCDR